MGRRCRRYKHVTVNVLLYSVGMQFNCIIGKGVCLYYRHVLVMLGTHERVWGRDVRGKGCKEGDEGKGCEARDVREKGCEEGDEGKGCGARGVKGKGYEEGDERKGCGAKGCGEGDEGKGCGARDLKGR